MRNKFTILFFIFATLFFVSRVYASESFIYKTPENVSSPLSKTKWFSRALSLRDAGPFTENTGYIGFRVEQKLTIPTQWLVYATPLMNGDEKEGKVEKNLKFVTSFSLGPMEQNDLTPDFAPAYRSIFGSFNPPAGDGAWWMPEKFVWFKLYQYNHGKLSPGILLKGRVQVEL